MRAQELRALLEARGLRPHARFGQNFLVDPALVAAIPRDAGVGAGDAVLEVGPGAGALTRALLDAGARVLAVEVDRGLHALLEERFAAERAAARLELVRGDVLAPEERFHPAVERWWSATPAPSVVANLPYAISGPFLARLAARTPERAHLLVQREVAAKAAGPRDGGEWNPLGVRLALRFAVRVGRRVPPEVFWPRPEVDSAFLVLEPRADAISVAEERRLAPLLQEAFGQRRKRLLPRLRRTDPRAAAALAGAGVAEDARPGALPPEVWRRVLGALD